MAHFVYDDQSFNSFPKADLLPVPGGADVSKYIRAVQDWNQLCQFVLDVKTQLKGATAYGLTPQATDPLPASMTSYLWPKSDGTLQYKTGGVSKQLLMGTAPTAGSVFFAATGGFGTDATNFFWDDTNNRLGIGTNAPAEVLDVYGALSASGNMSQFYGYYNSSASLGGGLRYNHKFSSGSDRYSRDGRAGLMTWNVGEWTWQRAASGTANNPITWTTDLTLDVNGRFGIGGAPTARFTVTDTAVATGNAQLALFTGAAHTNLTASTETIDVNFALSRTVQHATGALTTQRAVVFNPPTYSFVGASTITNCATVAIAGGPTAGSNATITNRLAFWVQAQDARFDGHFLSAGTAPSIAANSGAGTGPTISIAGSDIAGTITLTTGTAPGTSTAICTVTFATAFAAAPKVVVVSASLNTRDAGAATWYYDQGNTTTTTFKLDAGSNGLAATTAYKWNYFVIG